MIGIVAAMQIELEKLKRAAVIRETKAVSGLTFTVGTLEGHEVVMTVSGEGKVNAALCTEAMILLYSPRLIINTGVAGALSPTLHVPDVAIARAVVEHDYDISPLGYQKGEVLFPGGSATSFVTDTAFTEAVARAAGELGVYAELGTVATGDAFIAERADKERLHRDFGAIACEMEGGAVGHTCFVNKTPFAVIRAISDNADDATVYDPERAADISVALTRRALSLLQ
jgi:adenosylhomocysteine nucleosidase